MRAAIVDRRPQIVRPSSAWTFSGGAYAESGVLTLPAVPSSGTCPLIPVPPGAVAGSLSGEVFVPSGGDERGLLTTWYYASDRLTSTPNRAGNSSNGRAFEAVEADTWVARRLWPTFVLEAPEIRWLAITVSTSSAYGTAGSMYRNLRVSFTM